MLKKGSFQINLIKITFLTCCPFFTDMSWRGKSEEMQLRVTCEWSYVTVQWKWWLQDYETALHATSNLISQEKCHSHILLYHCIFMTYGRIYYKKQLFKQRFSTNCIWFCQVRIMVFNTTFNNISVIPWQSVLLVEETRVIRDLP